MELVVRKMNWVMRRTPTHKKPEVVKAVVPDFKKEHNHFCKMIVLYDTGIVKVHISRVLHNRIRDTWVVDGMHVCLEYKD